MGMWYTRSEAQKRFSFFFSSTTLAGAFGGVLAAGIGKMEGIRGYSGWRWVFIIEGLLTAVVGLICFFLVSDFPEEVKWLNDEERDYLRAKLAKDVGKANHNTSMTWREVLDVFKDCECSFIRLLCLLQLQNLTRLQTRSSSLVGRTLDRSSRLTVGNKPASSVQDQIVSDGITGYAYFAPTIIKTYGYDGISPLSCN